MRALWQSGDIREAIDYARLHEQLTADDVMVEPQFPEVRTGMVSLMQSEWYSSHWELAQSVDP